MVLVGIDRTFGLIGLAIMVLGATFISIGCGVMMVGASVVLAFSPIWKEE